MYKIFIANLKAKKNLKEYMQSRKDISDKLDRLKLNPRIALDAHPLHGKLRGKWSCWLGSNIRIIYTIDDIQRILLLKLQGLTTFTNIQILQFYPFLYFLRFQ